MKRVISLVVAAAMTAGFLTGLRVIWDPGGKCQNRGCERRAENRGIKRNGLK